MKSLSLPVEIQILQELHERMEEYIKQALNEKTYSSKDIIICYSIK